MTLLTANRHSSAKKDSASINQIVHRWGFLGANGMFMLRIVPIHCGTDKSTRAIALMMRKRLDQIVGIRVEELRSILQFSNGKLLTVVNLRRNLLANTLQYAW